MKQEWIYRARFASLSIIFHSLCTYHEQNGTSSLMVASHNGHVEVVDKLLQHGATVDLQENVCVIIPYNIHELHHQLILLTEWVACSDVCI